MNKINWNLEKAVWSDKIKSMIPRWSVLKQLEKNYLVKSSFIWFMLVPVFAKFLEKFGGLVVINFNSVNYTFNLSLPFSWQLFFYSACFFAAGSIVVKLFCPKVVMEHDNYKEFSEFGKSWPQINGYVIKLFYNNMSLQFPKQTREKVNSYLKIFHNTEFVENQNYSGDVVRFLQANRRSENENQAFWYVYTSANNHLILKRVFASVFYAFGFSLLIVVAIQNIKYVINASNIVG